jgi:hypothetical protein
MDTRTTKRRTSDTLPRQKLFDWHYRAEGAGAGSNGLEGSGLASTKGSMPGRASPNAVACIGENRKFRSHGSPYRGLMKKRCCPRNKHKHLIPRGVGVWVSDRSILLGPCALDCSSWSHYGENLCLYISGFYRSWIAQCVESYTASFQLIPRTGGRCRAEIEPWVAP